MSNRHTAPKRGGPGKWPYIAGATALLALLTVVLCVMGGVFDFHNTNNAGSTPEPPVVFPSGVSVPTPAPADMPVPTFTPEPMPTPSPTPAPVTFSVTAIAGKGGRVSPAGMVQVEEGDSITFTVIPDEGFELSELKIDGVAVEGGGSYTFDNVTADHSLYAVFRALPESTPTPQPTPEPTTAPEPTAAP